MAPLPELTPAPCSECGGQGCFEVVTAGGFDVLERCDSCNGRGTRDVCPDCLEVPDAFTDACGCARSALAVCEICEWPVEAAELDNAAVCAGCRGEMVRKLQQEADDYQVWVVEQTAAVRL